MEALGLKHVLVENCKAFNIVSPYEIQKKAIPSICQGKNILAIAPTGKGKTATYVIGILNNFIQHHYPYFALVILPTRELTNQAGSMFALFGARIGITVAKITGGSNYVRQENEFFNYPHIIVATPGRMSDFIQLSSVPEKLQKLRFIVLDEFDMLIKEEFYPQVSRILNETPFTKPSSNTQLILFSATLSKNKDKAIKLFKGRPYDEFIMEAPTLQIDHKIIKVEAGILEIHVLYYLLTSNKSPIPYGTRGIIFVKTIKDAEIIYRSFSRLGVSCVCIHSIKSTQERNHAVSEFAKQTASVLIATDVASRGLDFQNVDYVISYGIPNSPEVYIHRAGRTGRSSDLGVSYLFQLVKCSTKKRRNYDTLLHQLSELGITFEPIYISSDVISSQSAKLLKTVASVTTELDESTFVSQLEFVRKRRTAERHSYRNKRLQMKSSMK